MLKSKNMSKEVWAKLYNVQSMSKIVSSCKVTLEYTSKKYVFIGYGEQTKVYPLIKKFAMT